MRQPGARAGGGCGSAPTPCTARHAWKRVHGVKGAGSFLRSSITLRKLLCFVFFDKEILVL